MKILKRGSRGAEVTALQKQLLKLGYSVGNAGADGDFGAQTEKAVKSFQRSNQIKIDGEVGQDTQRLLDIATGTAQPEPAPEPVKSISGLPERALLIAFDQFGVREIPRNSNRGKDVEKYLASVGLGGGYAWCMAYVYWCVSTAAADCGVPNPLYKTGGVLMQWNQRQNLRVSRPQQGDIFIMDLGKGAGHCGFVDLAFDDHIYTIEGNTNEAGSREGDGVYKRRRTISSCKGFLRLDK